MRTVQRWAVISAAAALLCLCAASPAFGDEAAEKAKQYYKQGVKYFDAGQYTQAADSFRKANELKPTWKMHYNIGQSEAAAKRYGLALEAFEKYMIQGGDEVGSSRREEVLAEIQRLRMLVGAIEVEAGPGVALVVDGVKRGESPFTGPVRVAAGTHQVTMHRGNDVLYDKTVTIAGGMTTTLKAGDKPIKTGPPPPVAPVVAEPVEKPVEVPIEKPIEEPVEEPVEEPDEEPRDVPVLLIAGISCGVVGLGGIGLGAFGAVRGAQDYDDYKQAGDQQDWDQTTKYEDETLPKDRLITGLGFGIGGAFLAGGVALIVIDRMRAGQEDPAGVEAEPTVRVLPAPGGVTLTF
jgi:hypothetical protein